jgi:hypothetical protein
MSLRMARKHAIAAILHDNQDIFDFDSISLRKAYNL